MANLFSILFIILVAIVGGIPTIVITGYIPVMIAQKIYRKVTIWRKIMIPVMAKQILSSSFLIFVSSLTELTLSSMLASAGTKTIGLTIFNLQQGGDYSLSAAMSAVIVFIVFFVYSLVALVKKKDEDAKRPKVQEGSAEEVGDHAVGQGA